MDPLDKARIGKTELLVTRLGQGGAAIGGLFTIVTEEAAVSTVRRAVDLGLTLFDTAPLYGRGKSERLVGKALGGFPRDGFVLSTKVGRLLIPHEGQPDDPHFKDLPGLEIEFDYSRDGMLRSIDDSLERLGLDRIDVALIHDADDHYEQAIGEALPTLADLRSQGVIKAVGAGMNQWEMLARFAREGDFDCFLLAGRYTLLDQSSLKELLPICEEKTISIIVGGPFNSGILASDLSPEATYDYAGRSARCPRRGPQDQGGMRPLRRPSEGGGAPVRPGPSGRRRDHPRGALRRGDRGELRYGGPPDPGRPLGRAKVRKPNRPGVTDTLASKRHPVSVPCFFVKP